MKMNTPDKRVPQRTCTGCRRCGDKSTFIRLAISEGRAVVDHYGTMPGRGAYICPDSDCLDKAIRKKSISRALKSGVSIDVDMLRQEIEDIEKQI